MLNASEIKLAPFGRVLVASVGAAAPEDLTTDFSSDWFELGYITEDGVSINPSLDTTDFMMWQSLPPVKTSATGLTLELQFSMSQVNTGTTSLYFLNAPWVEVEPGVSKLDLKSDQLLEERAMAVEWNDDSNYDYRFIVPRGFVADRENIQLQRTSLTLLGITYRALDFNGDFFHILSNNPSLAPSS